MFEKMNAYLAYQGDKYIKPEKAGELAAMMEDLKALGQSARKNFGEISQKLAVMLPSFEADRVSQWMNQAQVCRPHFWCYYRQPSDSAQDVAMAIRLYGTKDDFGISVEVSFLERKKADDTLIKQNRVLNLPITAPLYYFAQEKGISRRLDGNEENRLLLQEQVASGQVRKVLVKYDVPIEREMTLKILLKKLLDAFQILYPYYELGKS